MEAVLAKCDYAHGRDYPVLKGQIDECSFICPAHREKMYLFLRGEGVQGISEIDYSLRLKYEKYLTVTAVKRATGYINAFDRVVMGHRNKNFLSVSGQAAFEYKKDEEVYLPYEARADKTGFLFKMQDKRCLAWDFSYVCPKSFKKQVSTVLSHIIECMDETEAGRLHRRHLVILKCLYGFCCNNRIYDLMALSKEREEQFCAYAYQTHGYFGKYAKPVVNLCRKILFLGSREINWHANVWYMQRFLLDEARVNESSRVETISFLNIKNSRNRHIFQDYMKYLIGLTDMSISTIRAIKYRIEEFILYIDEKHIYEVCASDIDRYIGWQLKKGNRKEFIDRKLTELDKWYRNLLSYGCIGKMPFDIQYYASTKFENTHSDRAVEEKFIRLILKNLGKCEEKIRLMFLTQLCTARRISEVCQIRAGNIRKDGGDYWACFYQPKMHEDIMVPIPKQLFVLLDKYINSNNIGSKEHVFQSESGKAYRSGAYQKKMSKFCMETGICEAGYDFKSHDFRHTVATLLYNQGASIQAIRDFLGHKTDEMTKQYIDFIPKEVEKKSREFFKEKNRGTGHGRQVIP